MVWKEVARASGLGNLTMDERFCGTVVSGEVSRFFCIIFGQKFEKHENEEILYFVISLSKLVKF